jgi:hypothetical protein
VDHDRSVRPRRSRDPQQEQYQQCSAIPCHNSEETSIKVHCVSNATRTIPRPKKCHGNIPRSNMSQNVTGSFKEYSCTNTPAFMHLINLTASLLHKICKKSLTTVKLKSLFGQFASETGFTHP